MGSWQPGPSCFPKACPAALCCSAALLAVQGGAHQGDWHGGGHSHVAAGPTHCRALSGCLGSGAAAAAAPDC
jgi:hypothetical protein